MFKLGFIGTGVMAGAILDRTLINAKINGINAEDILVFDLDTSKTAIFSERGVQVAKDENEVFSNAETVLLGVKPQFFGSVMEKVTEIKCKNIISIMAGVKIETLRKVFGAELGIVRVMPNTPCRIGRGIVALCFDKVSEEIKAFVNGVFSGCGKTLEISEDKFDAVTGISGSGPAYLYMFADALIKSGENAGLTHEEAAALSFEMLEGSAAYAKDSGIPLEKMVDMVCSKGGTTIEAVNYFRSHDLYTTVDGAVSACIKRSKELSKN